MRKKREKKRKQNQCFKTIIVWAFALLKWNWIVSACNEKDWGKKISKLFYLKSQKIVECSLNVALVKNWYNSALYT